MLFKLPLDKVNKVWTQDAINFTFRESSSLCNKGFKILQIRFHLLWDGYKFTMDDNLELCVSLMYFKVYDG